MKKTVRILTAAILVISLLSGAVYSLAANPFAGHWAEATLTRAKSDALILGGDAGIDPDVPLSGAQMVTILCRVFSGSTTADLTEVSGITKSAWYYGAAAQAASMGFLKATNGWLRLETSVSRSRAFLALAEAFQLIGAQTDTSGLSQYADSGALAGRTKMAAAALTAAGYVKGDGNALRIDNNMSLSEFLTILYRIIPNYHKPAAADPAPGGTVISDNNAVTGKKFSDGVYFDGTTSSVSLIGDTIPRAVLRCDSLKSLTVLNSRIDRLVFAAGGGDVSFTPGSDSTIRTVVVGDGQGTVTLGGHLSDIEVTGSGRSVVVTSSVQNLLVSGSSCSITLNAGVTVANLQILGAGTGNTVTVNGTCTQCDVYGAGNVLKGSGTVEKLGNHSENSQISVKPTHLDDNPHYGLSGIQLSVSAPDKLPPYKTLSASVAISGAGSGQTCTALWYLDDALISKSDVKLGNTTLTVSYPAKNTGSAPQTVTLSFVLYFEDPAAGYEMKRADRDFVLDPPGSFDPNDVFHLVTSDYQGDFTTAWTQARDFSSDLKTAWVDLKGYYSKTNYLVWVNIAYQRANVFIGSAGNWTLVKSFLVGTGSPGRDTPTGTFSILGRDPYGWTSDTYTVKPVVYFYSYAYAFHSRLYYPGTTEIEDDSIGFPVSHGCVRMYDEDVAWIYDNVPTGTTVVVY